MWALIAFIALGIVVATLIEVNERIKAQKRAKDETAAIKEKCPPQKAGSEDCSTCELTSICTKEVDRKRE